MTDEELSRLGRALPFAEPPPDRIEEMRTAVIASMPASVVQNSNRRRRIVGGIVMVAAAAAAAALWLGMPSPSISRNHATVAAIGDARFTQIDSELVWLAEGIVHVDVSPLGRGERFRIMVGDGEVEVRGTEFDVEAHLDRLVHVAVRHGHVEVRWHGQVRLLDPGERWDMRIVAAAPVISTAPVVAAPPVVAPLPPLPPLTHEKKKEPPASSAQAVEQTFRAGWDALQAGDASTAANAFERVVTLDPRGELAEDAEFWRADALKRAGRAAAAREALVSFLVDFPRSARAGEAAVRLGWLLIDANDLAGAEAQFKRGSLDPAERVRASAEAGIAEVARRLANPVRGKDEQPFRP